MLVKRHSHACSYYTIQYTEQYLIADIMWALDHVCIIGVYKA